MPKVSPLIPTMLVLEKLSVLDPNIQLIPEQVGMILGISPSQVKKNRIDGEPPKFVKQGGAIRYRLGDVRAAYEAKQVFNNTLEAAMAFTSFGNYLSNAGCDDQWPFAIIGGKPIDFFESFGMPMDDEDRCDWLTLLEYLDMRGEAANIEKAEQEGKVLATLIGKELPDRIKNVMGK